MIVHEPSLSRDQLSTGHPRHPTARALFARPKGERHVRTGGAVVVPPLTARAADVVPHVDHRDRQLDPVEVDPDGARSERVARADPDRAR